MLTVEVRTPTDRLSGCIVPSHGAADSRTPADTLGMLIYLRVAGRPLGRHPGSGTRKMRIQLLPQRHQYPSTCSVFS